AVALKVAFQHLARCALRQSLQEHDAFGHLVVGDALLEERPQARFIEVAAGFQDDRPQPDLAPGLVFDTDDRALGDRDMVVDGGLDLDGEDVLATGDEHLLAASDYREEALAVDDGQIAGPQLAAS